MVIKRKEGCAGIRNGCQLILSSVKLSAAERAFFLLSDIPCSDLSLDEHCTPRMAQPYTVSYTRPFVIEAMINLYHSLQRPLRYLTSMLKPAITSDFDCVGFKILHIFIGPKSDH